MNLIKFTRMKGRRDGGRLAVFMKLSLPISECKNECFDRFYKGLAERYLSLVDTVTIDIKDVEHPLKINVEFTDITEKYGKDHPAFLKKHSNCVAIKRKVTVDRHGNSKCFEEVDLYDFSRNIFLK